MDRITQLRKVLAHGTKVTQSELDTIRVELNEMKLRLRPKDKIESLPLYDEIGVRTGTYAPRWLCHVLALRHRCAHVLLVWRSPAMGDALVLQIRNWDMDDSPGRVDISAGGHMTAADSTSADAVWAEMGQEVGLQASDLEGPPEYVGGYAFDEERPTDNFFNSEWRDVYIARVKGDRFGAIRFLDGEVAGIFLVPLKDAATFLGQSTIPIATGLKESLPKCLTREYR